MPECVTQGVGQVVRANAGMCGKAHVRGLIPPGVSFLGNCGVSRSINVRATISKVIK